FTGECVSASTYQVTPAKFIPEPSSDTNTARNRNTNSRRSISTRQSARWPKGDSMTSEHDTASPAVPARRSRQRDVGGSASAGPRAYATILGWSLRLVCGGSLILWFDKSNEWSKLGG